MWIISMRSVISDLDRSEDDRPKLTNPLPSIFGTIRSSRLRASMNTNFQSSGVSLMPCHVTCVATSVRQDHIKSFCGIVRLGFLKVTRVPAGAIRPQCPAFARSLSSRNVRSARDIGSRHNGGEKRVVRIRTAESNKLLLVSEPDRSAGLECCLHLWDQGQVLYRERRSIRYRRRN